MTPRPRRPDDVRLAPAPLRGEVAGEGPEPVAAILARLATDRSLTEDARGAIIAGLVEGNRNVSLVDAAVAFDEAGFFEVEAVP